MINHQISVNGHSKSNKTTKVSESIHGTATAVTARRKTTNTRT
jgi:hypothetical protein